jgi:hypothetical protein
VSDVTAFGSLLFAFKIKLWLSALVLIYCILITTYDKRLTNLFTVDRDRAAYHLGYNNLDAIAELHRKRFIAACEQIYSNHAYWGLNGIKYWLNRCDRYLLATDPTRNECFSLRQQIIGDVNRTTINLESRDIRGWMELYLQNCDRLAFKLNVPNLKRFPVGDEDTWRESNLHESPTLFYPDNSLRDESVVNLGV